MARHAGRRRLHRDWRSGNRRVAAGYRGSAPACVCRSVTETPDDSHGRRPRRARHELRRAVRLPARGPAGDGRRRRPGHRLARGRSVQPDRPEHRGVGRPLRAVTAAVAAVRGLTHDLRGAARLRHLHVDRRSRRRVVARRWPDDRRAARVDLGADHHRCRRADAWCDRSRWVRRGVRRARSRSARRDRPLARRYARGGAFDTDGHRAHPPANGSAEPMAQ